MKKLLAVFFSAAWVVLMVGCGAANTSQAPGGEVASQPAVESTLPASEKPASNSFANENSITGTVTDATMNTIVIQTAAGETFAFGTEGAEIQAGENGLLIGDTVTLYYTGALSAATGTQTAAVTRVVVNEG